MWILFAAHNMQPISINKILLILLFKQPSPLLMGKLRYRRAALLIMPAQLASSRAKAQTSTQVSQGDWDRMWHHGVRLSLIHLVPYPSPPGYGLFWAVGYRNGWRHCSALPGGTKETGKSHEGEGLVCPITASESQAHTRYTIKLIGKHK